MNPTPDNPPAFPRPLSQLGAEFSCEQEGMTLRDYFAAKAMQGMISGSANPQAMGYPEPDQTGSKAYQFADAMLKAREQ